MIGGGNCGRRRGRLDMHAFYPGQDLPLDPTQIQVCAIRGRPKTTRIEIAAAESCFARTNEAPAGQMDRSVPMTTLDWVTPPFEVQASGKIASGRCLDMSAIYQFKLPYKLNAIIQ